MKKNYIKDNAPFKIYPDLPKEHIPVLKSENIHSLVKETKINTRNHIFNSVAPELDDFDDKLDKKLMMEVPVYSTALEKRRDL